MTLRRAVQPQTTRRHSLPSARRPQHHALPADSVSSRPLFILSLVRSRPRRLLVHPLAVKDRFIAHRCRLSQKTTSLLPHPPKTLQPCLLLRLCCVLRYLGRALRVAAGRPDSVSRSRPPRMRGQLSMALPIRKDLLDRHHLSFVWQLLWAVAIHHKKAGLTLEGSPRCRSGLDCQQHRVMQAHTRGRVALARRRPTGPHQQPHRTLRCPFLDYLFKDRPKAQILSPQYLKVAVRWHNQWNGRTVCKHCPTLIKWPPRRVRRWMLKTWMTLVGKLPALKGS